MINDTLLEKIETPVQTPVQTREDLIAQMNAEIAEITAKRAGNERRVVHVCWVCESAKMPDGRYIARETYSQRALTKEGYVVSHGSPNSKQCYNSWMVEMKQKPTEAGRSRYELDSCPA